MSLQWVYRIIREDYDIQKKGIHFLNLLDLQYDSETMTLADFYNQYQTIILTNTGRNSDVIRWNNNTALTADEIIGPTTEDLILLDVIHLIDS